MSWVAEFKARKKFDSVTWYRISQEERDRLIACAELLKKILDDGTDSLEGKRVWPLRAAYWREGKKLLTGEWVKP